MTTTLRRHGPAAGPPVVDTGTAVTAVPPPAVTAAGMPSAGLPHCAAPEASGRDSPQSEATCAGFAWREEGQVGRLWLTGELDSIQGRRIGAALDELAADPALRDVTVDLSAVSLLDNVTARVLLHLHWRLQHRGGRLRVLAASRQARRVVRWCAADELLHP